LSACVWHPKDPKIFITSSADSTIRYVKLDNDFANLAERFLRIWDVENRRKQKTVIVVKSKERGARTKVTACAYSNDGKVIAGGEKPCVHLCQANAESES
jgi:WD repeat-containing protein 70